MRSTPTSENKRVAEIFLKIQGLKKKLILGNYILVAENFQKIIGRSIAEERRQHDLSQKELARVLGISNTHLCTIEKGSIKNLDIIFKVSVVFKKPPEYFFQTTSEQPKQPEQPGPDVYKRVFELENEVRELRAKYGK